MRELRKRLRRLLAKWRRRNAGAKRQRRLYRRTGKRGHYKAWQRHVMARRYIRSLIRLVKKRIKEERIDWRGHEPLSNPRLLRALRVALETPGLYVTSTTGGKHSPTSHHYSGNAVDCGSDDALEGPEKAAQQRLFDVFGPGYFAELFGPLPWYVKNGKVYKGTFPGHDDHLHIAVL